MVSRHTTGTRSALSLAGLHLSLIFLSNALIRPVRDQMIVETTSPALHWLFSISFILTLLLSPIFSLIMTDSTAKKMIRIIHGTSAVILFGVYWFVHFNAITLELSMFFFVMSGFLNLLTMSLFWCMIHELLEKQPTPTLLAKIGSGALMGAIIGSLLIPLILMFFNKSDILLLAGLINLWAIFLPHRGRKRNPVTRFRYDAMPDPFIVSQFSANQLCYAAVSTFMYALVITQVAAIELSSTTTLIIFALRDLIIVLITFGLQHKLIENMIHRYGMHHNLIASPMLGAVIYALFIVVPSALILIPCQALFRSVNLGLGKPIKDHLYFNLQRNVHFRIKTLIDTIGYRLGDAMAAWIFFMLTVFESHVALGVSGILMSSIWIYYNLRIAKLYRLKN